MWKNLLKSDLHKSDYNITWKKIEVSLDSLKNKPEELIHNYKEEGYDDFDTVDVGVGLATVEGMFEADVRHWGIKGVYSFATSIAFDLTFDDSEGEIYETFEIEVDSSSFENDTISGQSEKLNPAQIDVEIDMKGQTDPSKFEISGMILWQGSY